MLQSILFATDFRPASLAAESVAIRLAGVFGSHLSLMHVIEPISSWSGMRQMQREQSLGPLSEQAARLTGEKVAVTEQFLLEGPPAGTIVRQAQERNSDLILIGAGEQTSARHFRAGPVAEAVVQHATTPVLTIQPNGPELRLRTILCPVDGSAAGRHGLENAVRLARVCGARVIAMTVVPEVSWLSAATVSGVLLGAREEYARMWREEFDALVHDIDWCGASWSPDIRYGKPHEQIAASVQDHEADLIVMGSTSRSDLSRAVLGSTTRRVLRDLACSLLVVKKVDVVESLVEDDLRHIEVLLAEGRGLLEAGSYHQAAMHLRQALARNPFHPAALELLEKAAENLGDNDEAERCRRRLHRLHATA
jgi:nucleotide-binding universal stress UspA family protein